VRKLNAALVFLVAAAAVTLMWRLFVLLPR